MFSSLIYCIYTICLLLTSIRKLWANLLAATLGTHMCCPMGPVPLPSRADEPVSSCQCPHRSNGTERGSALHGGRDRKEGRRKRWTLFLSLFMLIWSLWMCPFLGVWVWYISTCLWPPIQSSNHSYYPRQVSFTSYWHFFSVTFFLQDVCLTLTALSFIWQSDR